MHDLPSAHVYIRMPFGKGIDDIPEDVLEDCMQLVKHNSIQGDKLPSCTIVWTPWTNLNKTPSMDVGQVAFHDENLAQKKIAQRNAKIYKALEKTKVQKNVDLQAQREARDKSDRIAAKKEKERLKNLEKEQKQSNLKADDILHYKDVMKENKMHSNKTKQDIKQIEDDFM